MIGYKSFGQAKPNDAHKSLSQLEFGGHVNYVITQNVDRLHQKVIVLN